MNKKNRPVKVLILSCLYISMGTIGFAYHFRETMPPTRDTRSRLESKESDAWRDGSPLSVN
jgi:hypothetical protein